MENKKARVLVAKIGLDSEANRARLIARSLRASEGIEVIYTGLYRTIEEVADIAIQNDMDIIIISIYSGSHMTIFPKLRRTLDKNNAGDIILLGEGLVPEIQIKELKESGIVKEIFKTVTPVSFIIEWIQDIKA